MSILITCNFRIFVYLVKRDELFRGIISAKLIFTNLGMNSLLKSRP